MTRIDEKKKVIDLYRKAAENHWIRGALQAIPYIGGTLDEWFFQFAEKERQIRIDESLKRVEKKIKLLEEKVDVEYIQENIEEYAFLFERFILYVANDYRQDMRENYSNMIGNFSQVKYSKKKNKDIYLAKLSELTPDHLVVLKKAIWFLEQDTMPEVEKSKTIKEFLTNEFVEKGMDNALFQGIFTDLINKGLINRSYHPTYGGGFYSHHVTDLGKTLIQLVE